MYIAVHKSIFSSLAVKLTVALSFHMIKSKKSTTQIRENQSSKKTILILNNFEFLRMNSNLVPFALLFFGVFGQTKAEQVKVDKIDTAIALRQQPTQTDFLYKIFFAIYLLVSIVVLRNLLTAMMSDTYHRIQVHFHVLTLNKPSKSIPNLEKKVQNHGNH